MKPLYTPNMFTGNTRDRKSKSSNETKGNNPIIPIMWNDCIDLFKKLKKKKKDWRTDLDF